MFPIKTYKFEENQEQIFDKYFAEPNGDFHFEGMWFRNQRLENAKASGYIDESTQRRRYIHFYNTYQNINSNLAMKYLYITVSATYPKEENDKIRQHEGIWQIYDYTVVNLGTE